MRAADCSPISAGWAVQPRGNKETSVPRRVTRRQATGEPWGAAGTADGPGGAVSPRPHAGWHRHHPQSAANLPGPAGQECCYCILNLLKTHSKEWCIERQHFLQRVAVMYFLVPGVIGLHTGNAAGLVLSPSSQQRPGQPSFPTRVPGQVS